MSQSVFYCRCAVHVLHWPEPYNSRLCRHKHCLFLRCARWCTFITKTSMIIILVTYTTLHTYTTFASGERTAIDHFHCQNIEMENMLGLCYMYMFCTQKSRPEKWNYCMHFLLWFIQQKAGLVLVKERRYTTCTQTTAFCLYKKPYIFHKDSHVCKVFKCH